MTDDVSFAKNAFTTALKGFGASFDKLSRRNADAAAPPVMPDEMEPERRHTASNVDARRKAERAASNAGRKGSRPKKQSTIGLRCTAKQKMILLALMEHLDLDTQSDAAVEAILTVAAGYDIRGAADELAAVRAAQKGNDQ